MVAAVLLEVSRLRGELFALSVFGALKWKGNGRREGALPMVLLGLLLFEFCYLSKRINE